MTTFVVDASVAVKWLVYEDLSTEAVALARSKSAFIAPRILMTEVANALARKATRGEFSVDRALHEYGKLSMFFDEVVSIDDLIPVAIRNANEFRHPIYDLIYLEVAQCRGVSLVTADRRLLDKLAATDLARHIILLSDWRAA